MIDPGNLVRAADRLADAARAIRDAKPGNLRAAEQANLFDALAEYERERLPAHEADCAISEVGLRHGCTCAVENEKVDDGA